VKQAALARTHGIERVRLAGSEDLFDGGFGCEAELLLAEDFEVFSVEGDAVVVFVLEA